MTPTPINSKQQLIQSLGQFVVIFVTGIAVYKFSELTLETIWQPFLQGFLGALGVLGWSRVEYEEKGK